MLWRMSFSTTVERFCAKAVEPLGENIMSTKTTLKAFLIITVVGLFLFGCYSQGTEIQPNPGTTPTQTDASKPKPKPTPKPQPQKQQGTGQEQEQEQS
jgi:hypothetical protein